MESAFPFFKKEKKGNKKEISATTLDLQHSLYLGWYRNRHTSQASSFLPVPSGYGC